MSNSNSSPVKKGKKPITPPSDEELKELYGNQSMSIKELCNVYHVSHGTMAKWLRGAKERDPDMFKQHSYHHQPQFSKSKRYPGTDVLKQLYSTEGKTYKEISQMYGVSITTVANWMRDAEKQGIIKYKKDSRSHVDDDTLYRLLYEDNKTVKEISIAYNVSQSTASRWITNAKNKAPEKFYNRSQKPKEPDVATLKKLYIEENKTAKEIATMYDVTTSRVYQWISEARQKYPEMVAFKKEKNIPLDAEIFKQLYIEQNLSVTQISKIYNINYNTIFSWLIKARKEHPEINLYKRR